MDIIGTVKEIIQLGRDIYGVINDIKDIKFKYAELADDVLIAMELLKDLKESPRLFKNDNIKETLVNINENMNKLLLQLNNYKNRRRIRLMTKLFFRDIDDKKERFKMLLKRLRLLMDINRERIENSRLDIVNILKDKELEFWDKNFGSENNNVDFKLFIQSLENQNKKRLRKQQINVIKKIVDLDDSGYISVYEFHLWVLRFGPLDDIVNRTLYDLYDISRDSIYIWYFFDSFKEKIVDTIYDKGFGTAVVRSNFLQIDSEDNILFYICFVGWSLKKNESSLFEIPIIKKNNKLLLDVEKCDKLMNVIDDGENFLKFFKLFLSEREVESENLYDLYIKFQGYLRECAVILGIIYYPHFEHSSFWKSIVGEVINFLNANNNKWNRTRKCETWMNTHLGKKPKDRYCC